MDIVPNGKITDKLCRTQSYSELRNCHVGQGNANETHTLYSHT